MIDRVASPDAAAPPTDQGLADPPSTGALFVTFLGLGLMGFGGVLPMARHMIVEKRRWLTPAGFTELLGLCQFLPGGNIINLSVALGLEFRGIPGALAAAVGLIAAPTAIVIALGVIYDQYRDDPTLRHVFAGLAAAAASLLVATALKMLIPVWKKPVPMAIVAVCFLVMAVLRLPLLPSMLVLAPISIGAMWWVSTERRDGKTGRAG